ncbi:MAG: peptidylprolyl isomerase [Candidatus Freyarchaeum deiterrae]
MPVQKGNKVKVEYSVSLDDGTIFDSSEGKEPLEFEAGSGKVIKAVDQGVIGMKKGEEKEIRIEPKEAFGYRNPKFVMKIPKDKLPKESKEGVMIRFVTPEGEKLAGQIIEMTDEEATVDFNHPLAGFALNFKIKIADIS